MFTHTKDKEHPLSAQESRRPFNPVTACTFLLCPFWCRLSRTLSPADLCTARVCPYITRMTDSPARHNDLLQWDAIADEPYLALLGYPGLRLTPWRGMQETEAARAMVTVRQLPQLMHQSRLFNDPTVTKYSCRRPFP